MTNLLASGPLTVRLARMLTHEYYSDLCDCNAITTDENGNHWIHAAYSPSYLVLDGDIVETFTGKSKNDLQKFDTKDELFKWLMVDVIGMLNDYIMVTIDELDDEIASKVEQARDEKHEEIDDLKYDIRLAREDIEEKIDDLQYLIKKLEQLED